MKKNITKAIVFTLLLAVVLAATFNTLWMHNVDYYSIQKFYKLPADSCDVVLIGASSIREYYSAGEAFNETGITSYGYSSAAMPVSAIRYAIEDCEKNQSPKVYVIEIRQFALEVVTGGSIRHFSDSMRFSSTRTKAINAMLENISFVLGGEVSNSNDFYYPFSTYHSRWEYLTTEDFTGMKNLFLDYEFIDTTTDVSNLQREDFNEPPIPIESYNVDYLLDLIEYCNTLDAQVVFLDVPSYYTPEERAEINYVKNIIAENGYETIDFEDWSVLGFDYKMDFKNEQHLNYRGTIKFTDYLSNYLKDTYNLEDHRDNTLYSPWKDAYEGLYHCIIQ